MGGEKLPNQTGWASFMKFLIGQYFVSVVSQESNNPKQVANLKIKS